MRLCGDFMFPRPTRSPVQPPTPCQSTTYLFLPRAVAGLRAEAEKDANYDPGCDLDARIDSLVGQFQKLLCWAVQNDIRGYTGKLEHAMARLSKILGL